MPQTSTKSGRRPARSAGTAPRSRGSQKKESGTGFLTSIRNYPKKKARDYWISGGIDVRFLVYLLLLVAIGITMMFSASYAYASANNGGDSFYYFKRQLFFGIAGIIGMFVFSKIDIDLWRRAANGLMLFGYVLLVVVLIMPARQGDFHRWIYLGPFSFQPSEFAKFFLIVFLATSIEHNYKKINRKALGIPDSRDLGSPNALTCFVLYALIVLSYAFLVYKENHVSGAIIIFMIGFVMMYLAGFNQKGFVIAVAAVVVVAIVVIANPDILPPHAAQRITSWLDKDYDPRGARWQTNQALYAIGSGGFFGVGFGKSNMKQLYVSEPQNDFIFSIVCEELGFLGALIIVVLFGLLVWRGFYIGLHAKDKCSALLCMGISAQIGLQVALNILVVTDMMPNTGISLPFFSYGGTSLMTLLLEMGVILSASRQASMKKSMRVDNPFRRSGNKTSKKTPKKTK